MYPFMHAKQTAQGIILTSLLATIAPSEANDAASQPQHEPEAAYVWKEVSGTGIHYFDTVAGRHVMVHSAVPTETGVRQRSTETIDLQGDLEGRVLYHPSTVINNVDGRLINRGNQVFSGTVLGSAPVLLHDDTFRFEVDLATGAMTGNAQLLNHIAGPLIRCQLEIVGTGVTAEGNGLAAYSGQCQVPTHPAPQGKD